MKISAVLRVENTSGRYQERDDWSAESGLRNQNPNPDPTCLKLRSVSSSDLDRETIWPADRVTVAGEQVTRSVNWFVFFIFSTRSLTGIFVDSQDFPSSRKSPGASTKGAPSCQTRAGMVPFLPTNRADTGNSYETSGSGSRSASAFRSRLVSC